MEEIPESRNIIHEEKRYPMVNMETDSRQNMQIIGSLEKRKQLKKTSWIKYKLESIV